jgi:hypothetical protein
MLPVQLSVQRHLSVLHAPGRENPCSEVIKVNAISGVEFRGDLEAPAHNGKIGDFWQFVQFASERSGGGVSHDAHIAGQCQADARWIWQSDDPNDSIGQ